MWISKHLLVLSVVVAVAVGAALDNDLPLESDEIIEAVNNAKTTWKAGRNFDVSLTKGYTKNLVGSLKPNKERILPLLEDEDDYENLEIPNAFDARKKWSQCSSISRIPDQGPCASGWAVAAVGAFSDRLCIASKGDFTGMLSAQNLISCCCPCAVACGEGCKGGHMDQAWMHLTFTGICTGGGFKSHQGCQPYLLPPCDHNVSGTKQNCSSYADVPTPPCQQSCYNKKYKDHGYSDDMHNMTDAFTIMNNIKLMQKEIMTRGPVQCRFIVKDDFYSYKSGIYQHVTGNDDCSGSHALKVFGWGTEKGVPFWWAANSWGEEWGDNGFVKVRRETNECGIESEVYGGNPRV